MTRALLGERGARSCTSVSSCRVTSMITPDIPHQPCVRLTHRCPTTSDSCLYLKCVLKVAGVCDRDTTTLRPPLNWSSGESDQYSTLSICSWSSSAKDYALGPHMQQAYRGLDTAQPIVPIGPTRLFASELTECLSTAVRSLLPCALRVSGDREVLSSNDN